MIVITVLPFIGLVAAVAMLWNEAVGWTDLALFLGLYVICGFGITIGYHRMLTHRAFEAVPPLKAALLVFGSIAIQGSAVDWAVDHRTHHAFSDKEGDPHSPHHGFDDSIWGRSRDSATPTSAGCSSTTAPTASATRRICSQTG